MNISKLKAELQKMQSFDKEHFLKTVREWKHFWMNQKQNSEADYQNYFHRAFGIDANMQYSLAKRICKALAECEALEGKS